MRRWAEKARFARDAVAISQYTGHSCWIDLDVEEEQDWDELGGLALESIGILR